jgi:hypothetical protein
MRFFNTLIDVLYLAGVVFWIAMLAACLFFSLVFFLL